jgi:putative Holliday junction resolvase
MPLCQLNDLPARLQPIAGRKPRLLGVDYGSKVVGLAVSDPGLRVASPLTSLVRKKFAEDAATVSRLIRDNDIGGIVLGLPRNMDGSEGASAQAARAFVRTLAQHGAFSDAEMPVVLWDERLSTAAVERFLISDDMSRSRRDKVVDKMAAAYILQGALDAIHALPG